MTAEQWHAVHRIRRRSTRSRTRAASAVLSGVFVTRSAAGHARTMSTPRPRTTPLQARLFVHRQTVEDAGISARRRVRRLMQPRFRTVHRP